MSPERHAGSGWRSYQDALRQEDRRRSVLRGAAWCVSAVLAAVILFLAGYGAGKALKEHIRKGDVPPAPEAPEPEPLSLERLEQEIAGALAAMNDDAGRVASRLDLACGDGPCEVKTFLHPELQRYAVELLRRSQTVQAAAVVLRPSDGAVLAMASFDEAGGGGNLCLRADYPAASLFKIVSAAAALEASGYTPDRPVSFHGGRHTLYKGQLREKEGRSARSIRFGKAFAASINPVFGKLGIYALGRQLMTRYAEGFLFNRPIPFDLEVEPSIVEVPEDAFGLAEIASGFNKRTRISPLHAALLAASAVNGGVVMQPRLVDSVLTAGGEVLYRSAPRVLGEPIGPETAGGLKTLMKETVLTGTCRTSFAPLRRSKTYRNVDFGAKTGTINDREDRYKYDWLVSFAAPPRSEDAVCVAVLGVHGDKLGLRAGLLGRLVLQHHLKTNAVAGS